MRLRIQALLLVVGVLLATASAGALPAGANTVFPVQESAEQPAPYALTITSMDPAIPVPGSNLRVTTLFSNLGEEDLQRVTVVLRIGNQALVGDQDIENVSRGIFRPRLPIVRYSDTAGVVAGGEQLFSMEVPIAELALAEPGVYPVAVEAIDVNLGSIAYTPTVLVWMPRNEAVEPLETVMLWPLALPPARDADDVITSDSLAEQFAAGGRLDVLLSGAAPYSSQLSWVLDPQTQQTAEVLAEPHLTLAARSTTDRPSDPEVKAWLATLQRLVAGRGTDLSAMGYAYPDTSALVAAQLDGDVVLATTSSAPELADQLDTQVGQTISWSPLGYLDQPTLNVLRGAGADAVVVAAKSIQSPTATGLVTLTADSGTIPAVVGDPGLDLAAELAQADSGPVVARQQFLAATANSALQDPGGLRVFAPDPTWTPSADAIEAILSNAVKAPWMRLVPLSTTLAGDNALSPTAQVVTAPEPPLAPLAQSQTDLIRWGELVLAIIGQVTTAPNPDLQSYRSALLRSGSTWWRVDPTAGSVQLERTWAQILAEQQRLSINTAGTISFPGEEGRVPITVSNDLDVPVKVSLALSADPEYRLETLEQQTLDIPAGQRVSLEVPVRVIGSAPLTVGAQLITPDGLPYGPMENFELRTAAYSRVAQWVIWGALAILVLLVARSVTTRIKTARASDKTTDEGGHGEV